MDVYVLLDILLIILIALFIPIGFWRGAYREAFVTLGILFGASLGRFWGESWGVELSQVTRLHESGGAFMIAMLCLISATFLLGYSAGAAVPVPDPGWVARTLGALVAGANGALLLSFALRDIRVYLLSADDSGFLDNAIIAPFLSDGTGWILLVAAAVFVPIALVLALFGPDYYDYEYVEDEDFEVYEEDYPDPYSQRTMQHEQRRPAFEQAPNPIRPRPAPPEQTRPRPAPAEETRPIPSAHVPQPQPGPVQGPPVPSAVNQQSQDAPQPDSEPVATRRRVPEIDETQPHRPHFGPQPPRDDDSSAIQEQPFGTHSVEESTDEQQVVFGQQADVEETPAENQPGIAENRCANCQADISDADGFCPRCGERI